MEHVTAIFLGYSVRALRRMVRELGYIQLGDTLLATSYCSNNEGMRGGDVFQIHIECLGSRLPRI